MLSGLFQSLHRISTRRTFEKAVMQRSCSHREHIFMTSDSVAHETFPGSPHCTKTDFRHIQLQCIYNAYRLTMIHHFWLQQKLFEAKSSGTLPLTIASSGGSSASRAEEVHKQEGLCIAICCKICPFAAIVSCQHCCGATDEILDPSDVKANAIQSCQVKDIQRLGHTMSAIHFHFAGFGTQPIN